MVLPLSLGERIVMFLRSKAPEEFNSKLIAIAIEAKDSSIRKELSRLLKDTNPRIVKEHHGFYRASTDLGILRRKLLGKPVLFHGIRLDGYCLEKKLKLLIEAHAECKKRWRKHNWYDLSFEGRNVSVMLVDSGYAQVVLNASANPLDYLGWARFRSFLEGLLPGYIGDFLLKDVDIHCDIREFQLQELKGMRLKVFDNAWFHIYQKTEDILRIEVSMVPKNLKFIEACEIVRGLVAIPTEQTYQSPVEDGGNFYR
jgi:hypothetical protein